MAIKQKLQEIQSLASELNNKLIQDFPSLVSDSTNHLVPEAPINGGNLFAGKYYAESSKLFISLNPGPVEGNDKFDIDFSENNWYWDNPEREKYGFWRNSNDFFQSVPAFNTWMIMGQVTSTFLIPWRTDISNNLPKYPELEKLVWQYSGRIVRLFFDLARPQLIIVSGIQTLDWLCGKDYLHCDYSPMVPKPYNPVPEETRKGKAGQNHQCSIGFFYHNDRGRIYTLQVPHFTRANNGNYRKLGASWVWEQAHALIPHDIIVS